VLRGFGLSDAEIRELSDAKVVVPRDA
jgi:hypothetical protein